MKRTPIRRVSQKKSAQDARLAPLRAHYRELGPCVLCNEHLVEIHEIAARSQSVKAVEYPDNWLRLCRRHHTELQHTDKAEQVIVKLHHICDVINSLCGKNAVSVEEVRRKLNQQFLEV